jgi:tetratricopeptide (TPR) repeat protein
MPTQDSKKKTKGKDDSSNTLKDLEYLLTEIPDEGEYEGEGDEEEDVYRGKPWRGLDWVSKAKALNEMERYREAIDQCDEALSINPYAPKALFVKGEAYRGLGNHREALDCYDKALRGSPNDEEIWYSKGVVLKLMERHLEALAAFEKATEVEDSHHDAWYEKAVILRMLGRHEESRAALEKAFRHYPFEERKRTMLGTEGRRPPDSAGTTREDDEKEEEDEGQKLDTLDTMLGGLMEDADRVPEKLEEIPFDLEDEKVLLATLNQSMNIQQISALVRIPLVSCYKKVRRMEELGLLRRVRVKVVNKPKRKRIGYYRTNLKKVKLYTDQGRLKLGIEFMQLVPSDHKREEDEVAMPPHD